MGFNLLNDKFNIIILLSSLAFFGLTLLKKFQTLAYIFGILALLYLFLRQEYGSIYANNAVRGNTFTQIGYAAAAFSALVIFSNIIKPFFSDVGVFALVQVFVFFFITGILIILTREAESAIILHIATNGFVILNQYGVFSSLTGSLYSTINSALATYSGFGLPAAFAALSGGNIISLILVLWGWAIVIPFLETMVYAAGLGAITKGRKDINAFIGAFILAAVFMAFHIFAKT